jgi:hypothetical protein
LRSIRGGIQIEDYRISWTGDHRYLKEIPGWFWGFGQPVLMKVRWTPSHLEWTAHIPGAAEWPDISEPTFIPSLLYYEDRVTDGTYSNTWRGCVVPLWLPAAATFALPALRGIVWTIRRRRRTAGLCRTCGYDLRTTSGRCPECGAPVPNQCAAEGSTLINRVTNRNA